MFPSSLLIEVLYIKMLTSKCFNLSLRWLLQSISVYMCVCQCCNKCPQCFGSLAAASASGDRYYQENMVLLGEIGFLSDSLIQG